MTPERCPHCQQRMPKPKVKRVPDRICRSCGDPVLVHHKWKHVTDGTMTWVEHRHCDNPESYRPART
jgi:hypothetical protein